MDLTARIGKHFDDSPQTKLDNKAGLLQPIADAAQLLVECLMQDGKIMACGNGGSAADAQHFAAEIVGRFTQERKAWPAIALNTDTSLITAVANDYSYSEIFSRPKQLFLR